MSEQEEMNAAAITYLAAFDPDDWGDRYNLIETLGNFADATAVTCGTADFADFRRDPNVMRTMQWLNITRGEYRRALDDSQMPEPGIFALLHLLGLDLANSLPKDRDIRRLMPILREMYDLFSELVGEIEDPPAGSLPRGRAG